MNNSSSLQSWGLAVLRVIVGVVFLMHGGQKVFIWGFHGVAGFLGGLGIPFPAVSGVVLTVVELLGGAALVLGLLTRWAALLLAVDMLVAIKSSVSLSKSPHSHKPSHPFHLKHGFFMPAGVEYPLMLLTANVTLLLSGPGPASVDGAIAKRD
jgi:putative oxidoreductase